MYKILNILQETAEYISIGTFISAIVLNKHLENPTLAYRAEIQLLTVYLSFYLFIKFLKSRISKMKGYAEHDNQDLVALLQSASLFLFFLYISMAIFTVKNNMSNDGIIDAYNFLFITSATIYPTLRTIRVVENPTRENKISLFIPVLFFVINIFFLNHLMTALGIVSSKMVTYNHIKNNLSRLNKFI